MNLPTKCMYCLFDGTAVGYYYQRSLNQFIGICQYHIRFLDSPIAVELYEKYPIICYVPTCSNRADYYKVSYPHIIGTCEYHKDFDTIAYDSREHYENLKQDKETEVMLIAAFTRLFIQNPDAIYDIESLLFYPGNT